MSTSIDVDKIADGLLKILGQDQEFRREWERKTAERLQEVNRVSVIPPFIYLVLQEYLKVDHKIDDVTSTFEELIRIFDLATQSFLDLGK